VVPPWRVLVTVQLAPGSVLIVKTGGFAAVTDTHVAKIGLGVGFGVGFGVGRFVGFGVGRFVGAGVGVGVGSGVGVSVGVAIAVGELEGSAASPEPRPAIETITTPASMMTIAPASPNRTSGNRRRLRRGSSGTGSYVRAAMGTGRAWGCGSSTTAATGAESPSSSRIRS